MVIISFLSRYNSDIIELTSALPYKTPFQGKSKSKDEIQCLSN